MNNRYDNNYQNGAPRQGSSRSGSRFGDVRPTPPSGQRRPANAKKKGRARRRNAWRVILILIFVLAILAAAGFCIVKYVMPNDPVAPANADLSGQATVQPTATISHSDHLAALMAEASATPAAEETVSTAMMAAEAGSVNLAAALGEDSTALLDQFSNVSVVQIDDLAVNPNLSNEWLNVLLLGSDERKLDDNSRTDAMIICSINLNTGAVKLTSIMRDLAIDFDELGDNSGTYRINAANFFGKEELAMRVVNESFGLNIENYVHVNFYGFQQIAQAIGGVEMDITEAEMEEINHHIVEQAYAAWKQGIDETALPNEYLESFGENTHLDGRQTLAYARIRKIDSDYARAERQRKVMAALLDKVKHLNSAELLNLMNVAAPHFRTNMSLDTILSVAIKVIQNGVGNIDSFRLPVNGTYTQESRNGQSMLYDCDWEKNTSELHYFIYG